MAVKRRYAGTSYRLFCHYRRVMRLRTGPGLKRLTGPPQPDNLAIVRNSSNRVISSKLGLDPSPKACRMNQPSSTYRRVHRHSLENSNVAIRNPALLAMAGDFTIQFAEFLTYSTHHYMQMHDPISQDLNMLFVDGHIGAITMRPKPDHLVNSDYHCIHPGTR